MADNIKKHTESSDYLKIGSQDVEKALEDAGNYKNADMAATGTFPQNAEEKVASIRESVQMLIEKSKQGSKDKMENRTFDSESGSEKDGYENEATSQEFAS